MQTQSKRKREEGESEIQERKKDIKEERIRQWLATIHLRPEGWVREEMAMSKKIEKAKCKKIEEEEEEGRGDYQAQVVFCLNLAPNFEAGK